MATIIKRESQQYASGVDVRDVAFDLKDMAGQADAYLETVRAEALKIVQQAEQQAAQIRKDSERAGQAAAEAAIERILDEKVAKQMRTLTPAVAAAVKQIEDAHHDWLRHWESSATKLACEIAKRIVRRELTQQPEIAVEWVQDALKMCAGSAKITVRLNPNELVTLGNQVQQLVEVFGAAGTAHVVADPSISVGGCRIETKFGEIDNQLETQLERLQEELS